MLASIGSVQQFDNEPLAAKLQARWGLKLSARSVKRKR
jgi:hypothetical protein